MSVLMDGNFTALDGLLEEVQSTSGLLFDAMLVSHTLPPGADLPHPRDDYKRFLL